MLPLTSDRFLHVFMKIKDWKSKNRRSKNYAHFDQRVLLDDVWRYISCPENVAKHSFYPFISYEMKMVKYKHGQGKQDPKIRKICYAAHLDNKIYQYYAFLLSERYNRRVVADGFNDSVIAYRNNMRGMTNIHFAKRAFDAVKLHDDAYVLIGDFKGYFDNLDHRYLKKKVCDLLGANNLSPDFYNIFKSITRYGEWSRDSLLKLNGFSEKENGLSKLNELETVLSKDEFRKHAKECITKNNTGKGIPQGSAISAVLANIYLLDFDKRIAEMVAGYQGLYMRYSDDFIIVIPEVDEAVFADMYMRIKAEIDSIPELIVEPHKTQIYHYYSQTIVNCNDVFIPNMEKGRDEINYLGFTFDGKNVRIRDKTISKFYYRMNRKAKGIAKADWKTPQGHEISARNLYKQYSVRGAHPTNKFDHGNFLTYAERAERVFEDEEKVKLVRKRNMAKLAKATKEK